MKPRRPDRPAVRQPTPDELVSGLLRFIEIQFYPDQKIACQKDRPRLLKWVVLKLASWLNEKGVTLPPSRYQEIVQKVLMDSLRFGDTGNITYLPAYLSKVIESHLAIHGDEYYEEAKAFRSHLQAALQTAQKSIGQAPDPIRELAAASRLLKPKKRAPKPARDPQLNLL